MSYKKQNVLCGAVSCLILAALLFAVGYCIMRGVSRQDTPFGLSPDFISFKTAKSGKAKTKEVIDTEKDRNITIISQYKDENYMALYDTAYYFYSEKMIDFFESSRYFSGEDYREGKPVGIYVTSEYNLFNAYKEMKDKTTPLVKKLLFSINSLSRLYKEDITYIINQMRLEYLGDWVCIDSEDKEARDEMKEKLLQAGYVIEDSGYKGAFHAFWDGIVSGGLYTKVVLVPALSLYAIFLFTVFMHLVNNREVLQLHKLHGGEGMKVLFSTSRGFLLINGAGSFLVILFYYFLFCGKASLYFSFRDCLLTGTAHIIVTMAGYCLVFFLFYKNGREWDAVK